MTAPKKRKPAAERARQTQAKRTKRTAWRTHIAQLREMAELRKHKPEREAWGKCADLVVELTRMPGYRAWYMDTFNLSPLPVWRDEYEMGLRVAAELHKRFKSAEEARRFFRVYRRKG